MSHQSIYESTLAEHKKFNGRMSDMGVTPSLSIADKQGICLLAHADFMAFEGDYSPTPSPFLMLNLCTGYVGRMKREGDGPSLEGVLRSGTVAIGLPNTTASGYWSKTQMLGIAINLDLLASHSTEVVTVDSLLPAASQLHNEPLLSAVMTALWRDAELHGLSGAFFEQGLYVLLKRLVSCHPPKNQKHSTYPLQGARLQRVLDFIESRLSNDIRVTELAGLVGQDVRSFTRSFYSSTGYAPYAYFTFRRMEYAKQLLLDRSVAITDIAMRIGYANPSKFSAAFRRVNGITPSEWRRML
ncbi:helix-turn-helix domain-containing protein [Marinomonas algicola]|uniref:helix-turn-helix domain-containing protein n=1 Tax=Marinomonas algicola TaxID=2773454 RepID=UPI001749F464|nr:AraC family transcriptional regulator [Marinomonas algicola]